MKRIVLLLLFIVSSHCASAQWGALSVTLDSDAERAVLSQRVAQKKSGFAVCIFADNGQSARSQASEHLSDVQKLLPYEPSTVEYENPFFKVYVGECYNRSEAVRLLGLLKGEYPRAIISIREFDMEVFSKERFSPLHIYDPMVDDSLTMEIFTEIRSVDEVE